MKAPIDMDTAPGQALPATLAMLSHEFRTPLNGVLGMARLLETTRLTAEQRSYVEALKTSGDHLLSLVNDLLDLARLDAGKVAPDRSRVEIEPLLQQVCELMSPRAQEKGIEICWAVQSGLKAVISDEGRLRQILLNFAGNAVKFTEVGGVLVTAGLLDNGRLRLAVRDTGPGVEPEALAQIFEPFTQGALGAKAGGSGLGLAIVQRLAGSLSGEASAHAAPGGGAEFRFEGRLDLAFPEPADLSLAGKVVGVVTANPVLAEAVGRQLEASGARAGFNDSMARLAPADVRLIDHALMSGRRIARPPAGAPAIALIRPEDRDRIAPLKAAGWAGYLVKPLRRSSLAARVLAALQTDASASAPAEDERAAVAAAPGARVLLAEDNPINALLAGALLEREGCVVTKVGDGGGALTALETQEFDLILMDVRMPGLGGLETVRALRSRGVLTPVAAFTADAFDDDRRACMAAGMDDFLVKPLTPAALRGVLARWVRPVWTGEATESKLAS
ncbi:MAG: hybrid sensor histidine kinase/response regulator [Caulobacteraceae bacterium]|nr:hybrid sensor histidine kinase/response regulator [Caulobacteraceae bacterium]